MCVHVPRLAAANTSNQMRLLCSLCRELLLAERSSARECPREAERLGSSPPAMVLRAIAGHATDALYELPLLREACDLPAGTRKERLISLVTGARRSLLDRLLPKQMSYRARLLELRRSVDVVRLMRATSLVTGYLEIADWCDAWLAVRGPLMDLATDELSWFAENPTRAMSRVSALALA